MRLAGQTPSCNTQVRTTTTTTSSVGARPGVHEDLRLAQVVDAVTSYGLRLGLPLWCRGSLSTTLLARALQEEDLRKRGGGGEVAEGGEEGEEAAGGEGGSGVRGGDAGPQRQGLGWRDADRLRARGLVPLVRPATCDLFVFLCGQEEEEEEEAEAMDEAVSAQLLFMMFHSFSSFVAARGCRGFWLSLRAIVSLWRLRCA